MNFIWWTFFPGLFSSFKWGLERCRSTVSSLLYERKINLPRGDPWSWFSIWGSCGKSRKSRTRKESRVQGVEKISPPSPRLRPSLARSIATCGKLARTLGLGSIFYLNGLDHQRQIDGQIICSSVWNSDVLARERKAKLRGEQRKIFSRLPRLFTSTFPNKTVIHKLIHTPSLWDPYGITFEG